MTSVADSLTITYNKESIQKAILKDPDSYHSSKCVYTSPENFRDIFTKFENTAEKELVKNVKLKFFSLNDSMTKEILSKEKIQDALYWLEFLATAIKGRI